MRLVVTLAGMVQLIWIMASIMILWFGRHLDLREIRWIWAELRPFYLPAALISIGDVVVHGQLRGWNILFAVCSLANWWFFKDVDKDDRWKRRKAKLVEKIQRQGARLVVVPSGGGS